MIQSWTDITIQSLQEVWTGILNFLPLFLGAIIVMLLGLIVASAFRVVLEKITNALKIDLILRNAGLHTYIERAGFQVNPGKFVGLLAYWFLIIVFFRAAVQILKLEGISQFLNDIIAYLPNIIVAILIMIAALLLANFLRTVVRGSIMSAKLHAPNFLGELTWWIIAIFGLLTALIQLGIAISVINTIITGFIAMIALAGGIAFGLGGKDYAAHLLEKFRRKIED
jgi:hypothetical protein